MLRLALGIVAALLRLALALALVLAVAGGSLGLGSSTLLASWLDVAAGALALFAALLALTMFGPWWRRVPRGATLAMVPVALALIAVPSTFGPVNPYRGSVF